MSPRALARHQGGDVWAGRGDTTERQGLRSSAKDVGYGQFTLTLSISRPKLPACRVLTQ